MATFVELRYKQVPAALSNGTEETAIKQTNSFTIFVSDEFNLITKNDIEFAQ